MSRMLHRTDVLFLTAALSLVLVLVIPCVLMSREAARALACEEHLIQLSRAFKEYESKKKGLPPRRSGFNDGNPYGGWGSFLYAHLENKEAGLEYDLGYDFFDIKNKEVVERQIGVFLCPASPEKRYVEIQSQASTKSKNTDKNTVYVSKAAATDFISSNGVLMARKGYGLNAFEGGRGPGNQRQPMADNVDQPLNSITDGLSNTLLLIEQAGRPAVWRNREKKDGAGQFGVSPNARGAWSGWGSIAFSAADADTGETPGRGDSTDCTVNCNNWFGIYGFHDRLASVLFCDGAVRHISDKLDPLTFAYLTIRDDGQVIHHDEF